MGMDNRGPGQTGEQTDLGIRSSGLLGQMLGIDERVVTPEKERRRNTLTFASIGLLFLLVVGTINLFLQTDPRLVLQGQTQYAELILLMFPVMVLVLGPYPVAWAEYWLSLAGFIIFACNNVLGGWGGDAPYWTFAYPYMVFFLCGQRLGWLIGMAFAVLVPPLMYFSSLHWGYWPYQASECLFYGVAFAFNVVTAAHFNLLRSMFQRHLMEKVEFNTRQARQHLAQLEFNATHDLATGMLNRQGCIETLREYPPTAGCLAIMAIKFCRINELASIFGVEKVDGVLAELAFKLRATEARIAWVARTRSDELVLAFTQMGEAEPLITWGSQIEHLPLADISGEFRIQDEYVFGLASGMTDPAQQADTILRQAEQALLFALHHRSRYQVYDAVLSEHFVTYNRRYEKLRQAIFEERLDLHYQPQIDLQTGRLAGVEALARWRDPEEGLIPPDIFIPIVESTGLLPRFSLWTIQRALRDLVVWQGVHPGVSVSINLSADALHDETIMTALAEGVRSAGVDPHLVVVELTESVMLQAPEVAINNMRRIVALGARLSIDDYGVGFSSLTYVKQLPAHELKIDRYFVSALPKDVQDKAIVESTIELGHDFGLKVLAEGVEEEATALALAAAGCDLGQGWYFGRPMPLADFLGWHSPWSGAPSIPD